MTEPFLAYENQIGETIPIFPKVIWRILWTAPQEVKMWSEQHKVSIVILERNLCVIRFYDKTYLESAGILIAGFQQ